MKSINKHNFMDFFFIFGVVFCVKSFIINLNYYQSFFFEIDGIDTMMYSIISTVSRLASKKSSSLNTLFCSRNYSQVLSITEFQNLKKFVRGISIYNSGLVEEQVQDYYSLRLLYLIDQSLSKGDKKRAMYYINKFLLNQDETMYNTDFGKTKDQIGIILHFHRKTFKVTPLEILESMGYNKKDLIAKGILETTLLKTKTCVCSTVLEILVMDVLPEKYTFVQKVIYCQGKKVMANVINNTNQTQPDYILEIKKPDGELTYVAFDSKAQKLDTFYKNLDNNGFSYQVLTISSTPDEVIRNHDASQQAEFKSNTTIFVDKPDVDNLPFTPLIPLMLVSTKDLASNVVKIQTSNPNFVATNYDDVD